MARSKEELTKQQEIFVKELVKGKTQRQAYYKAYPNRKKWKEKTVDEKASRLFNTSKVRARYDDLMQKVREEIEAECIVEVKDVIKELKKIGFSNITDFINFKTEKTVVGYDDNGSPIVDYAKVVEVKDSEKVDGHAIQEVAINAKGVFTFKLHDKLNALDKICKYLGMYTENINVKTNQEVVIIDDIPAAK